MPPTEESPVFTLKKNDWWKIAKGAGIALGGCAVTVLAEQTQEVDFGSWTAPITAMFAIGINLLRKWLPAGKH